MRASNSLPRGLFGVEAEPIPAGGATLFEVIVPNLQARTRKLIVRMGFLLGHQSAIQSNPSDRTFETMRDMLRVLPVSTI